MVVPQVPCRSDDDCGGAQGCGGRLFCSPDGTTDMEGAPLQRHLVSQEQCDLNYPPRLLQESHGEPAQQEGDAGLEDAPLPPQEGDGDGEDALVTTTTSPLCFCGFPEACMVVPQVPCRSDDDCGGAQGCGGRLFCSPDGTTDMEGAPLQRHLVSQAQCEQMYPPSSP